MLLHRGRATLLETPADLMLGVDAVTERTDHQQRLEPGDVLLLYSDGLVELRGCSLELRLQLLRTTVEEHAGLTPDALAELLLEVLGMQPTDDVALLVLEVLAEP